METFPFFQLTQFDKDWESGDLLKFVVETLQKDAEFRQHERTWDIVVSVEKQRVSGNDSDDESDDDLSTVSTQRSAQSSQDSAFESGGRSSSSSSGDRGTRPLNSVSMRPLAIQEEPSNERDEGFNAPARGSPSRQNPNVGNMHNDNNINEDSRQRALIAHQVIQMHISSTDYTAKDFYQLLDSNIKKGVKVSELRDTEGLTILHEVALRDRSDLFTVFYDLGIMLEMSKKRVSSRQSRFFDMTPLAVAEHLRTKGRDELETFIQKDKKITKLCKYTRLGQLDKMQEIISRTAEAVHHLSEVDGSYPIYWACVANSRPAIELLLSAGANLNIVLKDKERILPKICSLGHLELAVHLMKKYKLDPNQTGLGDKSPVERVSETGDFKLLQQLLKYGAQFSRLILHSAAKCGQVAFIQKMMTTYGHKLDVNARDPAGRTPIFHAADNAHVPALQVHYIFFISKCHCIRIALINNLFH